MGKIESSYYNSDLNKYIGENLSKTFTSIDVDGLQVKMQHRILRIYEYKHQNESIGYQQNKALNQLADIFRHVNDNLYFMIGCWDCEVLIIRGNPPFDSITVTDLVNGNEFTVEDKVVIDEFLSVEFTALELYKKILKRVA